MIPPLRRFWDPKSLGCETPWTRSIPEAQLGQLCRQRTLDSKYLRSAIRAEKMAHHAIGILGDRARGIGVMHWQFHAPYQDSCTLSESSPLKKRCAAECGIRMNCTDKFHGPNMNSWGKESNELPTKAKSFKHRRNYP
jgi:hypothetical protein